MFSVRHRSAAINSRFCLTRPAFRPKACRRLPANSISAKRPSSSPKKDPANTCRVRIFTPRTELDVAGHPSVGTACALVMKQHVGPGDPIRLILEENVGPVKVDVARRNGGLHGTLNLTVQYEALTC